MKEAKSTPRNSPPTLTAARRVQAYIDTLATSDLWHNAAATAVLAGSISGSPAVRAPLHRPHRLAHPRRTAPRRVTACLSA